MSITVHTIHSNPALKSDLSICVTATIAPHLLRDLREALGPIQRLHIVVSSALEWGGGSELCYRGSRVRLDREVSRVEIACMERDVETVMHTLQGIVDRSAGQILQAGDSRDRGSSSARLSRTALAV